MEGGICTNTYQVEGRGIAKSRDCARSIGAGREVEGGGGVETGLPQPWKRGSRDPCDAMRGAIFDKRSGPQMTRRGPHAGTTLSGWTRVRAGQYKCGKESSCSWALFYLLPET
jgi:hypothetical protein